MSPGLSILEDVRFGLRTLGKNREFAAVAITALGIGVNATVFSMANAVLFKNLPFANSDKILYIVGSNTKNPNQHNRISYPNYKDLQGR